MKFATTQFKIAQLRQEQVVLMLQALTVFVFCIFTTAFLPQILFKYYYAAQQLTQEPKTFEYIQTGSFVLGVAYFLFAGLVSMMKSVQIKSLEKQLNSMNMMGDDCCGGDCEEMCMCDNHGNCECGNCEVKKPMKSKSAMPKKK